MSNPTLDSSYPSLDFSEGGALTVALIAKRLRTDVKHVRTLIHAGEIPGLDCRTKGSKRACLRVPVESFRDYVACRIQEPRRLDLLRGLPKKSLQALANELNQLLKA